MVEFAWSWADYERCKREEERRAEDRRTKRPVAAKLARESALGAAEKSKNAEPGNVGTQGDAPCSDDCGAVTSGRAGAGGVVARPAPRVQSRAAPPPAADSRPRLPNGQRVAEVFEAILQAEKLKREALAAQTADLQTCEICGKKRRSPCSDMGCPIL